MEASGDGWLSLGALWGMSSVMGLCIGENKWMCFQALKSENFSLGFIVLLIHASKRHI